tara:strand:- start:1579 stop:1695 length:117 start_codon:yes stop_codon:yes gene_type:complete
MAHKKPKRYDLLPLDGTEKAICRDCLDAVIVKFLRKAA